MVCINISWFFERNHCLWCVHLVLLIFNALTLALGQPVSSYFPFILEKTKILYPYILLQKKLRSFHWSFLEISVMKCVSVLSQKQTHILPKNCWKGVNVLFQAIWWITSFKHNYSLKCDWVLGSWLVAPHFRICQA